MTDPFSKRCCACGLTKPRGEFAVRGDKKHRRSECKLCHTINVTRRKREKNDYIDAYKLSQGCQKCGYNEFAVALDLDHRPGEVKLFNPSAGSNRSWDLMLAEIAKCDVLCANCHRVVSHDRLKMARV